MHAATASAPAQLHSAVVASATSPVHVWSRTLRQRSAPRTSGTRQAGGARWPRTRGLRSPRACWTATQTGWPFRLPSGLCRPCRAAPSTRCQAAPTASRGSRRALTACNSWVTPTAWRTSPCLTAGRSPGLPIRCWTASQSLSAPGVPRQTLGQRTSHQAALQPRRLPQKVRPAWRGPPRWRCRIPAPHAMVHART